MVWVSGCQFATVFICFSFFAIGVSLKRFLSFFDCFMPSALSRFSYSNMVAEYCFGSLTDR